MAYIIKRGEIYWIYKGEYKPPVGHMMDPGKGRPAIIVSNDIGNTAGLTAEIVYLTTAPKRECPTHCIIESSNYTSTALCEQITTIDTSQIGDYIGMCTEEEMEAVDRCMLVSLGIHAHPQQGDDDTEPAPAPAAEYDNTIDRIKELTDDLAAARAQLELMKIMYNDLLAKAIK